MPTAAAPRFRARGREDRGNALIRRPATGLVSARSRDADHLCLHDLGGVCEGGDAAAPLRRALADPRSRFIDIPAARPGCWLAGAERLDTAALPWRAGAASLRRMANPTRTEIEQAARRIAPHIRRTPVLRLAGSDLGLDGEVILKLELLQATGSFKPRGAFNRMLSAALPAAGVVTASGGNHGAAVAHAARALGVPAEVFCPVGTPPAKTARIEGAGAVLHRVGAAYDEARLASEARAAETGALLVHAYDQPEVLAGQGTVGLELGADAPEATHVLVATGGGGLIGGIAAWYAGTDVEVVSVEPDACPTLATALREGGPVPCPVGGLAADSLGARQVGSLMFAVARDHVAQAVLVPDAAIRDAQRALWRALRLVAEPGGATALAALISGAWVPPRGARVAVVVCGANADPATVLV